MSDQTDLAGEHDPTERLTAMDQQEREGLAEALDNDRKTGFSGTAKTEEFDLSEALTRIESDQETDVENNQ